MSQNKSSNWQFCISSKAHGCTRISHYLICNNNSNVELVSQLNQLWKHLIQILLSIRQLSSSNIIYSKKTCKTINYYQGEFILYHLSCSHCNKVILIFSRMCSTINDVLQSLIRIHLKSLCNCSDFLWSKLTICVNINNLTTSTALRSIKLCCYSKSMTDLSFTTFRFSKYLCYRHTLNSASN